MNLTYALSKAGVGKGTKVALMPSALGYEEIGNAVREMEAHLLFVDHNDEVLGKVQRLFPEFEIRKADALTFHEEGILTSVHYRSMENYPHETIKYKGNVVLYWEGFRKMIRNIRKISPNFVLFSNKGYMGDMIRFTSNEQFVLVTEGFTILEEGDCKSPGIDKYTISKRDPDPISYSTLLKSSFDET